MIPTMVSIGERAMLRQFIAYNYDGVGEIVEIGTLAGSSAIAIMQGIRDTNHATKLRVYDAFLYPTNDLEHAYRKCLRTNGSSFRDVFDLHTRKWAESMIVTEGDAAAQKWTHGDIAFMHIDCSISREFHEAIAAEFYPHILAGGVIAHQDYDYERAPFIHDIMLSLLPWFKSFAHIETTKYFRCQRRPSREEVLAAIGQRTEQAA